MPSQSFAFRALALCATLASCATPSAPAANPIAAPIVERPTSGPLFEAIEHVRSPGVVAAVYRDGRLTHVYAWGAADCAGGGEANPFADFEIGSISKHMTAVALLRLAERGQVNIDATVGTYLTDIPEAWKRVTLRQLLTHTSGVPDYEEAAGYGIYETSPTPAQIFATVADRPLDFEPGRNWSYSNTGYVLLSLVVQRVSGEPFGEHMRRDLFAPLHLDHTFVGGYAPANAVLAQGCKPGEGDGAARIAVRPITEASTFGAGGISSTLQDWAAWDDAFQNGRLLSASSMQQMFTPTILPDGTNTGYGMAMEVDDFRGEPRRGHTGQTQGFVGLYSHFPNRHLSILILTNQYGAFPESLARALQIQEMPDLAYDRLPVVADPNPGQTNNVRRAIRQLILVEEPLDLLGDDMRGFATGAQYADQRADLHDLVATMSRFEYLRDDPPPNGGYQRAIYRATDGAGVTSYFIASWRDGRLYRVRWERN